MSERFLLNCLESFVIGNRIDRVVMKHYFEQYLIFTKVELSTTIYFKAGLLHGIGISKISMTNKQEK